LIFKKLNSNYLYLFAFIYSAFLFFLSTDSFGQEKGITYALFNGKKVIQTYNCFSNDLHYSNLNIKVVAGHTFTIRNTSLKLSLSNSKVTKEFATLNAFKNFNLSNWLLSSSAYSKKNSLIFDFKTTLIDGKIINQKLIFCINTKVVTRDFNPKNYEKQPDYIKMPVYFATDRNDTGSSDINTRFGGKRGSLEYGICMVSIPHDHKIGKIERPSIWRLEFSEDPKKHVVIQSIDLLNKDIFFKNLSDNIKKSTKKSSFLFIHGYNVSFADAAKRTAQISYDLLFDGEAVFYSWPSRGITADYTVDEANIEWAQTNIKNFLNDYLSRSDADEIYLVAHSMGNRGLTRALVALMTEKPELKNKIKEIILAAPDIDADVFKRDIAPQMVSKTQKPITLYVSSDDIALKASRQVHGSLRAGDAGSGVVLVKGIETIDASGIDTSFIGHSYFAETTSIISDIFDLIKTGKRAFNRKELQPITSRVLTYWKVKKKL